jgi:hypothetical protein
MDRKKLVKVLMATGGKEKQILRNKFWLFSNKRLRGKMSNKFESRPIFYFSRNAVNFYVS